MSLLTMGVGGGYAPAAVSYVGPGDVVSGAYAWYGLRGYNAAYATGSNPALVLVDQAGANQVTINILANGRLDVASINSWVTANSVSTIKVKQMHDQTGNSRHIVENTLANMPVLNLTGFGSLPAVVFTAASSQRLSTASGYTVNQPVTISAVYNKNGAGNGQELAGFNLQIFLSPSANFNANELVLAAGSSYPHPDAVSGVTDSSWHAAQGIANTTASALYVDSLTPTTGVNAGSNNVSNRTIFLAGPPAVSNYFNGSIAEMGIWNSAFTGTLAGNMNTNQHGSNGYSF